MEHIKLTKAEYSELLSAIRYYQLTMELCSKYKEEIENCNLPFSMDRILKDDSYVLLNKLSEIEENLNKIIYDTDEEIEIIIATNRKGEDVND